MSVTSIASLVITYTNQTTPGGSVSGTMSAGRVYMVGQASALATATAAGLMPPYDNATIGITASKLAVLAIPESAVTSLTTDLAAKVPTSRTITAGVGLSGGGDPSANRSLAVDVTVIRSTDTRLNPYNIASAGLFPSGYAQRIDYDDFIGAGGVFGQEGWSPVATGTGAAVALLLTTIDATSKARGVSGLSTGSTTTGIAQINLNGLAAGLGAFEQDWRIQLSAQPSAAQNFIVRIGLFDLGVHLQLQLTLRVRPAVRILSCKWS